MCTVTFVKNKDRYILTSNRDEHTARTVALTPKVYAGGSKKLLYPKDTLSGGTWFVADDRSNMAVLLNGGERFHRPTGDYRKSRGLILLDLISQTDPFGYWNQMDLHRIEPFTVVLFQNLNLYQLRWNGEDKNRVVLDITQKHIWSSSTLYSQEMSLQRRKWFQSFLSGNGSPTPEELLDFHRNTKADNDEYGLMINRQNQLKTLSITQGVVHKNRVELKYVQLEPDLVEQHRYLVL
ncbi:MAG: NRDE family protein [Sediminicola sp.]